MSVLHKTAFHQNRRDEVPNQLLARELVDQKNLDGIREIANNLWHENPNIQSDCLKVMYEIGYLDPNMIAAYAKDFLTLLKNKNNRLVGGSMIALSTIAQVNPEDIYPHHEEIMRALERGSVITIDNGVITLA